MLLIELLIDLFFLSDIALNFDTGYISEQVVQCPQLFAFYIRCHELGEMSNCILLEHEQCQRLLLRC